MIYDKLLLGHAREMLVQVARYIPTLLVTLVILIVGYVVAKAVSKLVHKLLTTVKFDTIADNSGVSNIMKTGGITHKPSEMISSLTYWVVMIITLVIAVKSIGLTMAAVLLDGLIAYIPKVISGVFILVLGMLMAKVVSGLVKMVAYNTDLPHAAVLGHLAKLAIVIHVTTIFLKEIGYAALFTGTNATILFGGVVFALALAFGLGGKDTAAKYLDVFKMKKTDK